METRTIEEVKVFSLNMNSMLSPKIEITSIVAVSYDKQKLIEWYEGEKVSLYEEKVPQYEASKRYCKSFRKEGPLEWYNPIDSYDDLNHHGQGIQEHWVVNDGSIETDNKFLFIQ